jgi:hypothetical protein
MTLRDPELLELLADNPELLAVADAVAATQRQPRRSTVRRRAVRLAPLVAVAVAVVAVALVLPQGKHGIVDRAIAAIGDGRILHIILDVPTGTVDVDLQSGHRTVQHYRIEMWADQEQTRIHEAISVNGQVYADLLWPQDFKNAAAAGPVDPAFAALWSGYRKALEDGTATRAGEGVAFGHRVYWLRFSPADAKSAGSEIAVDAQTFKPIVWRIYNGLQSTDQHIVLAETIDLTSADFTRHGPNPFLGQLTMKAGTSSSIDSDGAPPSTTVPRGWLSAGAEADGHKLAAVLTPTVTTEDNKTIHGILLVYGDLDHDLIAAPGATTVDELPQPDDPDTWAHIPSGAVEIQQTQSSGSAGDHLEWTGRLVKDNRYITITTQRGEQALVEIGRSLQPVR